MKISGPVYGILQTDKENGCYGLLCLHSYDNGIDYTPVMLSQADAKRRLSHLSKTFSKDLNAKYDFKVVKLDIEMYEDNE